MKDTKEKRITLATIKCFVKNNAGKLYIKNVSSFDGMQDCVAPCANPEFRKAEPSETGHAEELGYKGIWIVSRNSFSEYDADGYRGFEVYNCCGHFIVAVPYLTTIKKEKVMKQEEEVIVETAQAVAAPEAATAPEPVIPEILGCFYANEYGFTDIHPFEIVKVVSDRTIEVRKMKATLDPEWKPEFAPGGFAVHCTNQNEQRWLYEPDTDGEIVRLWKSEAGKYLGKWVCKGRLFQIAPEPKRFYDYNF